MKRLFVIITGLVLLTALQAQNQMRDGTSYIISLKKLAKKGNSDAMHELACLYKDDGIVDSAMYWAKKAALKGNMFSQSLLGEMYERQTPSDYKQAALWYEKAARQGYNWAQYRLGYFYEYGKGVEANDKLAERWLKAAAKQGACWGLPQYEYGKLYANGMEAKTWLLRSAEEGCDKALYELGLKYASGSLSGFEINVDSAFYYFGLAANKGIADAMWYLSTYYERGEACPQSYYIAYEWYRKSEANGSYAQALNKMGNNTADKISPYTYDETSGQIVLKPNPSIYYYNDLVYNHNETVKYLFFIIYHNGLMGMEKNNKEALLWLDAAAEANIFEAHYYKGKIFELQGRNALAVDEYKKALNSHLVATDFSKEEEIQKMKSACEEGIKLLKQPEK